MGTAVPMCEPFVESSTSCLQFGQRMWSLSSSINSAGVVAVRTFGRQLEALGIYSAVAAHDADSMRSQDHRFPT